MRGAAASVARAKLFSGVLNGSSDVRLLFHRHARSLGVNKLGPKGAKHIGAALKENTALQKLLCVTPWLPHDPCVFSGVLNSSSDIRCVFHRYACSLWDNNLGPEGAAHIGEALKKNTALQTLVCVALPHDPCRVQRGAEQFF